MKRLAAAAVIVTVACYPAAVPQEVTPADYVHLTTEFPTYGPGAVVSLRIVNPTEREYGYNLCTSSVDRLEGDSWIEDRPMLAEVCTMELRLLAPGGEGSFDFRLEANAPGGQYRFRTTVEEIATNQRLVLTSTPFAVTPRGATPP